MKVFNLVYRIKEYEDLRTSDIFYFTIKMLKNGCNDVFVHFFFRLTNSVVIPNTLKCNFLSQLFLNHLINVELNYIFRMFIIKLYKLLFHGSRTRNNIWSVCFCNF